MTSQLPDFEITAHTVSAQPRKLKATWSTDAAQDLKDLWGIRDLPALPTCPLDILRDAYEDPDYDPNNHEEYKGLYRFKDGRKATPEEIKKVFPWADKFQREVDSEIDKALGRVEHRPTSGLQTLPDYDISIIPRHPRS